MQVDILERDVQAGTARLRFTHNGVSYTNRFDLKMVVPGTQNVFSAYGVEFTEEMQQRVIDRLTSQVQREIEAGIIQNPPV